MDVMHLSFNAVALLAQLVNMLLVSVIGAAAIVWGWKHLRRTDVSTRRLFFIVAGVCFIALSTFFLASAR